MQNANVAPTVRDLSGSISNPYPSTSAAAKLPPNMPQPTVPMQPKEVNQLLRSLVQDNLNHVQQIYRQWLKRA